MALYDLARGGVAPEYGNGCKGCKMDVEKELPIFLQPDQRDGYHFRDKRTWKSLLKDLEGRYGLTVEDLQIGDKLRLFLQPNHANVKSIFVDFREPVAGFKFNLVSVNGADYSGKITKATYSKCSGIETTEQVDEMDTGAVEENSQYVIRVTDGYNAKVDAIDLEIVALPTDLVALENAEMQFARRFEPEGYMMPSIL